MVAGSGLFFCGRLCILGTKKCKANKPGGFNLINFHNRIKQTDDFNLINFHNRIKQTDDFNLPMLFIN
jgi:hypothetical protein